MHLLSDRLFWHLMQDPDFSLIEKCFWRASSTVAILYFGSSSRDRIGRLALDSYPWCPHEFFSRHCICWTVPIWKISLKPLWLDRLSKLAFLLQVYKYEKISLCLWNISRNLFANVMEKFHGVWLVIKKVGMDWFPKSIDISFKVLLAGIPIADKEVMKMTGLAYATTFSHMAFITFGDMVLVVPPGPTHYSWRVSE